MRQAMVILRKDLRETLRGRAFYSYSAIALVIVVVVGVRGLGGVIGGQIDALMEQGLAPAEVAIAVRPLMGTALFMLSLALTVWLCFYGNSHNLVMEKTKRSLESLLCTPLSVGQICLGKSLAVFVPCVVLGLLLAFAGVVGASQLLLAPRIGQSVMPSGPVSAATLVSVPLIAFCLASLLVAVQLVVAKAQWINGVLLAALAAVIVALNYGLMGFGLTPWSIIGVSLAVTAALALPTIYLFRLATKERIVLNSKG